MRDCILFRCHNQSLQTLENLRLISEQSGLDVFVVFDCTDKEPFKVNGYKSFNFSVEDYLKSGYKIAEPEQLDEIPTAPNNQKILPLYYNPEYACIWFMQAYPEYNNYWYIEYDVWFTGNWNDFFKLYEEADEDLLCIDLSQYPFRWWGNTIGIKKHLPIPNFPENCIFRFFGCISRMSRRLLETLDVEYTSGKHGYYELSVGSLAAYNGLTMSDLNKYGVVWSGMTVGGEGLQRSFTQRYIDSCPNMLFHPIR
jgi:hypothetical protein